MKTWGPSAVLINLYCDCWCRLVDPHSERVLVWLIRLYCYCCQCWHNRLRTRRLRAVISKFRWSLFAWTGVFFSRCECCTKSALLKIIPHITNQSRLSICGTLCLHNFVRVLNKVIFGSQVWSFCSVRWRGEKSTTKVNRDAIYRTVGLTVNECKTVNLPTNVRVWCLASWNAENVQIIPFSWCKNRLSLF